MSELIKVLAEDFSDHEYAHDYLAENSNLRIAAQVRALRVGRNWSQQDLAVQAGMKQARISKIEQADFDSLSLATMRRLAAAFDVALSVKFDSIENVVRDFVALSAQKLVCEDRVTSIARMRASSIQASMLLPPSKTVASNSIAGTLNSAMPILGPGSFNTLSNIAPSSSGVVLADIEENHV